ncbi:MAG: DNA primase, partial [Alphaproteobacteria bacterium]
MPQWILWKNKERLDKNGFTKVPIGINGRAISITNPKCFREFSEAQKIFEKNKDIFDGIGFCFTEADNFCGIDLDNVNKWNGWKEIVKKFQSYTEISPSQCGLHIITEGFLPTNPGEKAHGIKIGSHET